MCNEGDRVSPYSPWQSLAPFMRDSTNHCCQKQCHNYRLSYPILCKYVYRGIIVLPHSNTPILKVWGSASRARRSLTTDIVATIPFLNGHRMMYQWEKHAKRLSLRAPYSPFKWRILTFTGWNKKCHVIVLIKTDLSGFVVTMHGLVRTVKPIPRPNGLGIGLPISHAPSCVVTTNPSKTGLDPLSITPPRLCT